MRSIKRISAIMLVVLMLFSFAGCVLNEEKDATAVVATVNGVEYLKSDFNDFYTFYLFRQEVYGSPITGTDAEMESYKLGMFDEYILRLVLREDCIANGAEPDTETISKSVTELMDKIDSLEDKDKVLKKYGYKEEDINAIAEEKLTLLDYVRPFQTKNLDNSFGTTIAATVGETKIPMSTFYYYVLANYLMSADGDPYDTDAFYSKMYTYMMTGAKSLQYVKDNNLEIPQETITEMESSISMLDLYGLRSAAKEIFFLTDTQIDEAVVFMVNALAAQDVILNKFGDDAEFTDAELKTYYETSIDKYDKSTVKAYHILTEDKDFVQSMYDETGKTADGFMAVYEKYGKDEKVREATDLGEFGRGKMVDEFEDCAFGLKAGEIGMCDTEFGTHIVYVYESNITETTFESAKDEVYEDYKADHIEYFGQSHIDNLLSTYEDEEGDFRITPVELLVKYLYEKYDVKIDSDVAGR